MNFYRLDYPVEKTLNFKPSLGQKFLLEYTGKNFPVKEAEKLWLTVIDHKWYVSERLNRDIGLRVATVDYIANFYKSPVNENMDSFIGTMQKFFRTVFESMALMSGFREFDA